MSTFAVDTSCMVAAVCSWHERHTVALAEIEARLERGERLAVAAPALVEAFAVLTRLPSPHRLSATDAWRLIDANFVQGTLAIALTNTAYLELIRGLAERGVAGGRVYDAVIGRCAVEAGAAVLLTFNRRHFEPGPAGISIVEPG